MGWTIHRKILVLLSALFPFVGFWQMSLINVIGVKFATTPELLKYLISSYIYADALSLIPVGLLLDRWPLKKVFLLGILSFTLGTLLSWSFYNHFYGFLLARIITGVGHAFALMSCFRLIYNIIPQERQATWVSLVLSIAFCGGIMAQFPSLWIINNFGISALFITISILNFIVIITILWFLPVDTLKTIVVTRVAVSNL